MCLGTHSDGALETAPKPDINVFFKQKTVHLTNGVWDPFRVPGPISNPILDIGGESFLNGKDIRLAQLVVVVRNALKCNTLGGVLVPPIQLLSPLNREPESVGR